MVFYWYIISNLIVQWGNKENASISANLDYINISLPISFTTKFSYFANASNMLWVVKPYETTTLSQMVFSVQNSGSFWTTTYMYWFAIGF